MVFRVSSLSFAAALVALPVSGSLLVNGDFESGPTASSTAPGWNLVSGAAGGFASVQNAIGADGNPTQVLFMDDNLPDGGAAFGVPRAEQSFAAQSGTVAFSFDYQFADSTGFPQQLSLRDGNTDIMRINLNAGRLGFFAPNQFVEVTPNNDPTNEFSDWYRFSVTLDLVAGTAIGSVTNLTDGVDITVNGFNTIGLDLLGGPNSTIDNIQIADPNGSNVQADVLYDNFVLVPTPSAIALAGIGGLGLLRRRRA